MAIKDYVPLNLPLLANPYNWVVVVLMVLIAGLALSLLFPAPGSADTKGQ